MTRAKPGVVPGAAGVRAAAGGGVPAAECGNGERALAAAAVAICGRGVNGAGLKFDTLLPADECGVRSCGWCCGSGARTEIGVFPGPGAMAGPAPLPVRPPQRHDGCCRPGGGGAGVPALPVCCRRNTVCGCGASGVYSLPACTGRA